MYVLLWTDPVTLQLTSIPPGYLTPSSERIQQASHVILLNLKKKQTYTAPSGTLITNRKNCATKKIPINT